MALKPFFDLIFWFLWSIWGYGHCLCPDTLSSFHFFNALCISVSFPTASSPSRHMGISQDSLSARFSLEMSSPPTLQLWPSLSRILVSHFLLQLSVGFSYLSVLILFKSLNVSSGMYPSPKLFIFCSTNFTPPGHCPSINSNTQSVIKVYDSFRSTLYSTYSFVHHHPNSSPYTLHLDYWN